MRAERSLLRRLATKRALFGLLQTHPNPTLAEMAGMCGYDFLFLDGEHGVFSEKDYLDAFRALTAGDVLAVVRLAGHDLHAVGRYLDMGADALVVPNVSTAEQARALVKAMVYPPSGTRGFGAPAHRASRYGMDLTTHLQSPRKDVCLIVIIESALGVANVEEILAVDGIDGVLIGPSDLTADLGHPRDYSQPAYAEALLRVESAAVATGKFLGTPPHPGSPLEALLARGHSFFILGVDTTLICEAMNARLTKARSSLESVDSTRERGE